MTGKPSTSSEEQGSNLFCQCRQRTGLSWTGIDFSVPGTSVVCSFLSSFGLYECQGQHCYCFCPSFPCIGISIVDHVSQDLNDLFSRRNLIILNAVDK